MITIEDPDDAVPLARALHDGGLSCAEITFRTPRALEALRRITAEAPELFIGAGTVLTTTQAETAADAGAQFIVAPGFNPRVVDYCLDRGMHVYPGVATPTELEAALEKGLTHTQVLPGRTDGWFSVLESDGGAVRRREFHADGRDQRRQSRELSRVQPCRGLRRILDGAARLDRRKAVHANSR